jgi:hypothetical protein
MSVIVVILPCISSGYPCKQPHNQLKERSVGAMASSCTYSRICQPQIKELNSYVALRKTYTSSLGNKQELLDGGSFGGPAQNDNVRMASSEPYTAPSLVISDNRPFWIDAN